MNGATSGHAAGRPQGAGGAPRDRVTAREAGLLAVVLAAGLLLRLGDIDEPFTTRGWQQMDAFNSLQARNWIEHGWRALSFAPALDPAPPPDGRWDVFMHHPPGAPLLVAAGFGLFGVAEWAARVPAVALSMLQLLATWGIVRRLFSPRAALAAAALGATVPAAAFYGSLADGIGPLLMGFVALACWLHLRHLERPTRASFAGQLLAVAAAALVNWQGTEVAVVLALDSRLHGRRRDAAWLLLPALAIPALQLAHIQWVMGALDEAGRGRTLGEAFLWRTWGGLDQLGGPAAGLRRLATRTAALYTWPVCALAALGCLRAVRATHPWLLAGLLAFGVADMLVFLEGSVRHEYWCTLLAPGLLALAGAGAVRLADAMPARLPAPARTAALALLVALPAAAAGVRTVERFERIEDGSARDLGELIRATTRPGDLVLTCDGDPSPVRWYARRRMQGRLDDASLAPDAPVPPETAGVRFVLPERRLLPHAHERMLAWLRGHFAAEVATLPDGSRVHVFDLARRP